MNKDEFVYELAMRTGFTRSQCDIFYDSFLGIIKDSMLDGREKILFKGIMTIKQKITEPRNGRDPVSGNPTVFPSTVKLSAKISESLVKEVKERLGYE